MKKTLTRMMSLLLVLVMMLGVMPVVSADTPQAQNVTAPVTASKTTGVVPGDEITLTINRPEAAQAEGYSPDGVWSWTAPSGITTSSPQAHILVVEIPDSAAGTSITCTASGITYKNSDTTKPDLVATASYTINVEEVELNSITVTGASSVAVKGTTTLTAVAVPAGAELGDVTWESSDDDKATVSATGVVTGVAEGNVTITASVGSGENYKYYEHQMTVTPEQLSAAFAAVSVGVGATTTAKATISPAQETEVLAAITYSDVKVTEGSDHAEVKAAADGKSVEIKGKAAGSAKATCDVTVGETVINDVPMNITVGKATITFGSSSTFSYASDSDNTVILTPSFDIDGDGSSDLGDTGLTYEYTKLGSTGDISGKVNSDNKVEVTADAREAAALAFKLVVKDASGSVVAEGTASVSFYTTNNISVTMASGISTLKFSEYTHLKEGRPALAARILDGLESKVYGANDKIAFSNLTVSTEGTLSGSTLDVNNEVLVGTNGAGIAGLVFTPGTSGRADFNYTLYADSISDLPLCKGNIIISYGDTADIEYYAAYNKSVTFKESDFAAFWKKADKNSDLSYVKITTMPVYGTLYTSTSAITANKATTSQSFYYGTVPYGGKDLGSLTFVPPTTKLNEYDVYVTFTAYGKSALDTVTGRVVIHVNDVTNAISSRGITFGTVYDDNDTYVTTDDKTYADQIAETYWSKTGYNLGYVTFTLPAAEQATLYYKVTDSKVAQSTQLAYGAKLYYKSNSSSVSKLESAALIPAADFSGQLVLSFKAYDEAGGNETNGTITFNVTKKTASAVFSDVTAKSYGWASDSVDFLYYEGTAQGSNGKYNPAANITRQDFMLMLYRAFLAEDYGTFAPTTNFPDVVKGTSDYSKEIYQAVGVAKYLGIAQGTNDRFNPKANITRQEAMVLIYRTLETINKDLRTDSGVKLTSMKDASKISNWATAAISNLVSHGVIKGNNDYIKPLDPISRAEMAAILHRVITY